jgi:hypothetical protein
MEFGTEKGFYQSPFGSGFSIFGRRLKRIFYQNIPSPEAFFHPLYSVYHGDFQVRAGKLQGGGVKCGITRADAA